MISLLNFIFILKVTKDNKQVVKKILNTQILNSQTSSSNSIDSIANAPNNGPINNIEVC